MSVSEPGKIITPWAESGLKNTIPPAANPATGRAGFDQGFSAINMTAKEAGGIPPFGQDFNGIFYEVTNILRYMQAGGQPTFDAALATAIGGYPKGAMVLGDDGISVYTNRVGSNSTNPNLGGGGWARSDLMLREVLRRSYAEAGYNLVDGSFETGGTIARINDVLLQESTGKAFSGPIGVVDAGTDPLGGGFVDRSDEILLKSVQFGGDTVGVYYRPGTNYESAGTSSSQETRPWYHDFRPLGVAQGGDAVFSTDGGNMFMGPGAGNFTMRPLPAGSVPPGTDYNLQCSHNIGYGVQTLGSLTIGYKNSAFSNNALRKLTVGHGNTASGRDASHELTVGNENCTYGFGAGFGETTGNYRAAFGAASAYNNQDGDGITAMGRRAGFDHITGSYGIYIGEQAAFGYTSGNYSIFLGKMAASSGLTQGDSNLVIGSRITGLQDEKEQVIIADGAGKKTLEVHKDSAAAVKKASYLDLPSYEVTPFNAAATDGQVTAGSSLLLRNLGNVGNAVAQIVFQSRTGQPFSRIVSTAAGAGQMVFINDDVERLRILAGGGINPGADNTQPFGSSSKRWSEVFAGVGTINTSDAREKTAPLPITDAVLDAWGDVQLITYQWLAAIQRKGEDAARWHFGVIAQQVRDAFAAHSLDGTRYGLLCHDKWGDQYEQVQTNLGATVTKTRTVTRPVMITEQQEVFVTKTLDDGSLIKVVETEAVQVLKRVAIPVFEPDGAPRLGDDGRQVFIQETVQEQVEEEYSEEAEPEYNEVLVREAGDRWGIRADQCLFLEASYQRRRCERIEDRLLKAGL